MKLVTGLTLLLVLFFSACKKHSSDTQFVAYTDDTAWHTLASNYIHPIDTMFVTANTLTLSTNTSSGDTLHFSNGINIYCPAGFASSNGSVVNGNVNVSLLTLKNTGDFIKFARPTYSNNSGLLENTAGFKITLSQNNQALSVAPNSYVNIHFNVTTPFNSNNNVLTGDTTVSNTGNFTWNFATNGSLLLPFTLPDGSGGFVSGYDLQSRQTGWTACGRPADNNSAGTVKLVVLLPPNLTNKNASVYAILRNQKSVIRLMPEISSRTFGTESIPANTDITLVVMGKTSTYFYAEGVNTNSGSGFQFYKIKPARCTKDQIGSLLDSL